MIRNSLRNAVGALAVGLGLTSVPQSADAGPFTLCTGLANSSGTAHGIKPNGRLTSQCDSTHATTTLTTSTFGQFTGNAQASVDADGIHLYANLGLVNYQAGSYVTNDHGGITGAAYASALYNDAISIISNYDGTAVAHVSFDIDGTTSGRPVGGGISPALCSALSIGPLGGLPCLPPSTTFPLSLTFDSAPFDISSTVDLNFEFLALLFVSDALFPSPYTRSGFIDLSHTIVMTDLLVTDLDGNPIPIVSLDSSNEVNYPLSSLNARVPEPTTLMLFAAGLLGLAALRRRRQAKTQTEEHCIGSLTILRPYAVRAMNQTSRISMRSAIERVQPRRS